MYKMHIIFVYPWTTMVTMETGLWYVFCVLPFNMYMLVSTCTCKVNFTVKDIHSSGRYKCFTIMIYDTMIHVVFPGLHVW